MDGDDFGLTWRGGGYSLRHQVRTRTSVARALRQLGEGGADLLVVGVAVQHRVEGGALQHRVDETVLQVGGGGATLGLFAAHVQGLVEVDQDPFVSFAPGFR